MYLWFVPINAKMTSIQTTGPFYFTYCMFNRDNAKYSRPTFTRNSEKLISICSPLSRGQFLEVN